MELFSLLLLCAALLCTLVTGFLFAFAVVVMPGIRKLDDERFLRSFQAIDGVIQDGQPLFHLVWIGSIVVLLACAGFGVWVLKGNSLALLQVATGVYLLLVQLPTVAFNIPLNNRLQTLNLGALNKNELQASRAAFETAWNRWNLVRTCCACIVSILLLWLVTLV